MRNSNLVVNLVQDWYRNATERRELLALEDGMLRDIGITRAQAIEAAAQPLWRSSRPVEPLNVEPDAIRRHVERAHDLRSRAIADFVRRTAHRLFGRREAQPKARIRKLAPVAR